MNNKNNYLTFLTNNNIIFRIKASDTAPMFYLSRDAKGRQYIHIYGNTFLLRNN
jgi:hypothetical protein